MIGRSEVVMRFILLLLPAVLAIADAARRTTTATATAENIAERQRGHPRQHQDVENVWDLVDLQKLDNRASNWNQDPTTATNITEAEDSEILNTRQLYPLLPSPGDTNELPGPISPTIGPIPPLTPPPGCYAMRGQFPSPKSCANYLNCWDDVVTEQTCPNGLLFNDVTLVCDYDYNVNCGSRPLPTPRPPMPPGSKLCPEPNGRYRSGTNCSEFYVCVYRKPIKFGCPRGLVYNDILGVCDYPYNVDCKGAATPAPTQTPSPAQQPSLPPQPPTYPASPPYVPSQPPYVPSQPPYVPPQPSPPPYVPTRPPYVPPQPSPPPYVPTRPPYVPTQPPYVPSQPPYVPSQPQQPQQPSYGPSQQPSYGPSQPPSLPSQPAYPNNPWLSKAEPDPWHQRPVASQLEIDDQKRKELLELQDSQQEIENAWTTFQSIPASLSKVPCSDGDLHRLNDACTSVVVCRNGRPQLVQCASGSTYDRPSDTCKPFSIAKC